MKKILFDTNVILDVLLDRRPHAEASAAIWSSVEVGTAKGFMAAHAITTIHYLLQKDLGNSKARESVSALLRVFAVAEVGGKVLQQALDLSLADFEDAVTVTAARVGGCDCVVTRDPKGFRQAQFPCFSPEALLPLLPGA